MAISNVVVYTGEKNKPSGELFVEQEDGKQILLQGVTSATLQLEAGVSPRLSLELWEPITSAKIGTNEVEILNLATLTETLNHLGFEVKRKEEKKYMGYTLDEAVAAAVEKGTLGAWEWLQAWHNADLEPGETIENF